jgi:lysophospholipase L1-like esterase
MKPRVEVINTGVGNYNTSQEVAAFKERGLGFNPDMVILAFFLNDAEPTPEPVEGFLPRHSNLYVLAAAGWDNTLRWAGSRQDYKDYYLRLYDDDKPGWNLNRQALRDLIQLCEKRKIELRIAIVPELHKLTKPDYEFLEVHDKVRAIAKEGGVPVYDLLDARWPDPPETYWVTPTDAHPNEKGHRVLGEALYAALKEDRQIHLKGTR